MKRGLFAGGGSPARLSVRKGYSDGVPGRKLHICCSQIRKSCSVTSVRVLSPLNMVGGAPPKGPIGTKSSVYVALDPLRGPTPSQSRSSRKPTQSTCQSIQCIGYTHGLPFGPAWCWNICNVQGVCDGLQGCLGLAHWQDDARHAFGIGVSDGLRSGVPGSGVGA